MSDQHVESLNEFTRGKHPGHVGIELLSCDASEVTGHFVVRDDLVAGTGFLWAPVIITLADWLCAAGTPLHIPLDASGERTGSFTTVELKSNFLGSATTGETVFGRAAPRHVGRTTQVWDVEVSNRTKDRVIALFRATQMILYPK